MSDDTLVFGVVQSGRFVYGLVRDLAMAKQLVKCASRFGIRARNFDRADSLMKSVEETKPFLVILDFENLECESYKTLKEIRESADAKGVPVIGFVSQSRSAVKEEAERAGCDRVYLKTVFNRDLPELIARYAK
ncbi:MAG TPA: response regulator [Candidatus Omnitrophota bacterium]|nr:response regulator [Candidatus Omnitrophota bacterium]HQB12261.1 response regulator [Candidatus Omnitrophota bacterium]